MRKTGFGGDNSLVPNRSVCEYSLSLMLLSDLGGLITQSSRCIGKKAFTIFWCLFYPTKIAE